MHQQATRAGLPPELVLAVIDVESNFDRFAISSSSALGLMQVMPFWVKELGQGDKNLLFDIDFNVLLGCQILKYYLDMEHGDLVGPRPLQRQHWAGAPTPTASSTGSARSGSSPSLGRNSKDLKSSVFIASYSLFFDCYIIYLRSRRALPKPVAQRGERFVGAVSDDLDAPVRQVLCETL